MSRLTRVLTPTVALGVLAGLAACGTGPAAPREQGVCYSLVPPEAGEKWTEPLKTNVVARDQPQIEFCAARLEEMRLRFLRLGGSNREIVGAYQGQFIIVDRRGVSFSKSLEGGRFFALARTGDGRLAIPGAIQRDIDAAGPVPSPASPAPQG